MLSRDPLKFQVFSEYLKLIDELVLISDEDLNIVLNNFSKHLFEKVCKPIHEKLSHTDYEAISSCLFLGNLFKQEDNKGLQCNEETLMNLITIAEHFEASPVAYQKKSFIEGEPKMDYNRVSSILKEIRNMEKIYSQTFFNPSTPTGMIAISKRKSPQSSKILSDHVTRGSLINCSISISDLILLIRWYIGNNRKKTVKHHFMKNMKYDIYMKKNILLKIRLIPTIEGNYFIILMINNISSLISLGNVNNSLNFSLMLINSLSHEMFTPLHQIIALTEKQIRSAAPSAISTKKVATTPKQTDSIPAIDEGNSHLGAKQVLDGSKPSNLEALTIKQICMGLTIFVQNILDFANINNNTFQLNSKRFMLKQVFEYLEGIFSVRAKLLGNISISFEYEKNIEMFSDSTRLIDLIYIFIENSIRFTRKGGITVKAELKEGVVIFKIIDTGCGIEPKDLTRIKRMFKNQFLAERTMESNGIGIGLRIAITLIRKLTNAEFEFLILSEKNKGTTIQFEISQGLKTVKTANSFPKEIVKQPSKISRIQQEQDKLREFEEEREAMVSPQ